MADTDAASPQQPRSNSTHTGANSNLNLAGDDPPTLATGGFVEDSRIVEEKEDEIIDADEEGPVVREAKRRKNCPQLIKEELLDFSFDVKAARTPETTPKFGSFNKGNELCLAPSQPEANRGAQTLPEIGEAKDGEEEEDEEEEEEEEELLFLV
ncbi:hypothetical protein Dimus_002074 [Dionaea muscipula]